MRFNVACAAAIVGVASALPGWFDNTQDIVTLDDDKKVPGKNPLTYCAASHPDDIVKITSVDLLPNPPEAGAELKIRAAGTVFEDIEEGAYINLVVKYGLIRLINTKADLCEQTEKADLKCPIKKGILSVEKAVDIPKEVPPGKYTVHAEVINYDDKPIACLEAQVTFGGSKKDIELEL
ncbi:Phosphatidylglycerol/phosphatidylinositol transfer protein [Pestalotiopsis fici W106-1]|uniref:Phosphatidylglycerol/phosphatidylinositol transfer protein n=1 Tax=Pestalotiopsis fici (strain W106-1 / CGMCC3.15140) TaxID=1229662 RepID=W3XBH8_PESFW|nr:Phosphatidylglycerol/phosphatidylinositol transfer protein [Pestalotiopsis fici W106-1]ETS82772.1 Phosphatidylglycerol/phosphatidylinositol transfer protein [Pestalotiopsis fici W106-1]